jgi:hypothetical protein
MSSVQSALANQPKRQYVAAAPFNNDIFTYTLTTNPTTNDTTGDISANVVGANSTTCPAGRILRENGQKLYPGVNVGVETFMVGVIDTITLLSGYIDPNSPIYGVYSTALPFGPTYGVYPNIQYNGVDPGPGGLGDEGPPVFTNGNIICVSGNISTQTGSITSANGIVATTGQIRAAAVTALTAITTNGAQTTQTIDPTLGATFTIAASPPSNVASITLVFASAAAGSIIRLIINATTAQNTTFTFGAAASDVFSVGTLITNNGKFVISFVSDGTNFYETGRTAAQA